MPLSKLVPTSMPIGARVVTEGIYAGRVDSIVALRGSTVIFVLDDGAAKGFRFEDMTEESILRLAGAVAYRGDTKTYYVAVSSIVEAVDARGRVVNALNDPKADSASLISVGEWARQRAQDYHDDRLETLAQAAFLRALKLRDLDLGPDDYDGFFALAEESYKLLQRPSLREFYVREGVDAYVSSKGAKDPQSYYDAAKKAEALLPGGTLADQMLEVGFAREAGIDSTDEIPDYYALADKARQVLGEGAHYFRFVTLALDTERQKIPAGDYASLYALARKAKDTYPSYPSYRSLVWDAVAAEKSSMDARDSQAWFRLGNRILYFLDDRYQAGLCFREAVRVDPTTVDAREKLRELGYVYYQGRWWQSDELAKSSMFQHAQALEDLTAQGKVSVGMSREQVLRAKGAPEIVSFSGGGWGVTSQWIYHEEGKTLYVNLIADIVVSKGEAEN